ncbi:MAG: hypothetical protein AAF467_12690 [Actinomycetota bacterium]
MADITKRTAKRIATHLQPDEHVEAALLIEPKGTYGPGIVALALLPRTMSKVMESSARDANAESGGFAASFPGGSAAFTITNRRILVVPSNGLTFKDPAAQYELGSVVVGEISNRVIGRRMQLVFADGSAVQVDIQRGQPIEKVQSLLGTVGTV